MKKLFSIFLFLSITTAISAQDGDQPPVDTSDVTATIIKAANFKCDSAEVHLRKGDAKGSKKFYTEAIKD